MIRVRLKFDSSPVSYARKCWFVFDSEKCRLVGDVSHLIAAHFKLRSSHGIQLYMDDYLIPTNESAQVVRDNDIIQVKSVSSSLEDDATTTSSSDSSDEERNNQAKTSRGKMPLEGTSKASNPPPPPVKKLVSVTKKSASGGLHTKFRTSSSSSSISEETSSETSSSDSDSSKGPPPKKFNSIQKPPPASQWDVRRWPDAGSRAGGIGSLGTGSPADTVRGTVNSTRGKMGARGGRGGGGKSRRRKKKSFSGLGLSGDVVVGGPKDILTTKSTLYTNKESSVAVAAGSAKGESTSSSSEDDSEKEDTVSLNMKLNGPSEQIETARDYSSCPDLQGPPRVGDKLAFKILQLSSSYTPEVSNFLEASVLSLEDQTVKVRYTDSTMSWLVQKAQNSNPGKFSLEVDEQATEEPVVDVQQEVDLTVSELLEPKLVT